ncbi:MAG: TerD family protein [Raineya sp.]|nr:TerD family protein [Raineya sp.]MDW8296896.1 TerD family protein [Raineya sp.]
MSIQLDKKTGINLSKGSKISLEKEGKRLEEVCVGLNWGAIKKGIFFNLFKQTIAVDLDGSVTTYDENKQILETVYYRRLRSKDGAIIHSGDDRDGDIYGDDELDNEVIEINLTKVNPKVKYIVFYLNSYNGQDFSQIPYSKIRIFEGNSKRVDSVFATFNLSAEEAFKKHVSMVLGKLTRKENGQWEFTAIGEAAPTKNIDETILHIQKHHLN